MSRAHAFISLDGQQFGYLTVLRRAGSIIRNGKRKYATWLCRCTCGKEVVVNGQLLRRGLRKACAQNHFYNVRANGASKHISEYRSWEAMRRRCYDKTHHRYSIYGGRGIRVCDRWRDSFQNFLADMGKKPTPKHTVERKDNDGSYEMSNCRWATRTEQARNMRRSVFVEYEGERMLLLDVVAKLKLNRSVVQGRLRIGWSLEEAISVPVRAKKTKAERRRK